MDILTLLWSLYQIKGDGFNMKLFEYTALVDTVLLNLGTVRKRGDQVAYIQWCFDESLSVRRCVNGVIVLRGVYP